MAPRARWIGVAIGLLILGGIIWNVFELDKPTVFYVAKSAVPPATNVAIARSNGPVRAFFGPLSVLLILPDGSLWEWGHVGGSSGKIPVPTRVGTNNDWSQASLASGHYLGIHQDGTLWNWGVPYSISPLRSTPWPVAFPSEPEPVGSGSNWVQLAASSAHSAVLRRDGTIWAWGDDSLGQMGNGLGPHETNRVKGHGGVITENHKIVPVYLHEGRTNLVQVGTNNDWKQISSNYGDGTLGLRTDGTIWVWGGLYLFASSSPTQLVYSVPTQICRETNWVALEGPLAFNSKGEVWCLFSGPPIATAAVESNSMLLATNCVAGRTAFGSEGVYQIHQDGTLWAAKVPWSAKQHRLRTATHWRRIGERSDWISIDGWMGTAVGATADGKVWMWGTDVSQEGVELLGSKMANWRKAAAGLIRGSLVNSSSVGSMMPVQKEPRPLMILKTQGK